MSSENFPKALEDFLDYILVKHIDFEGKMMFCNYFTKSDGKQPFQTFTKKRGSSR